MTNLLPFAGLITRYGKLKSSDLTLEVLQDVLSVLKIDTVASVPLLEQVSEALRTNNISVLADIAGRPEILPKLMELCMKQQGQPTSTHERVDSTSAPEPFVLSEDEKRDLGNVVLALITL